VAAKPLILVPPSEAKTPGGSRSAPKGLFDDALDDDRREVIAALAATLEAGPLRRREIILNAKGPLMERAMVATQELAAGSARVRPAWKRFSGVVWTHLDPATLLPASRKRLLIPSSVYGLSSGEDRIADFRLKMNVGVGSLGTMASFWRSRLTPVIASHVKTAPLVSLLPKEHELSIDLDAISQVRKVVRIAFSDDGGSATVGHDAKAVKGVLARALLLEGLEVLPNFEWYGWKTQYREGVTHVVAPQGPNLRLIK
jgi:cytoplasmic iron level regulating protein YaaA (DUF328/UPF0246 family)